MGRLGVVPVMLQDKFNLTELESAFANKVCDRIGDRNFWHAAQDLNSADIGLGRPAQDGRETDLDDVLCLRVN